jgi:hypothetical protein
MIEQSDFYSIVVESSGAAPIKMTGTRDIDRQDYEECQIFGIHSDYPPCWCRRRENW